VRLAASGRGQGQQRARSSCARRAARSRYHASVARVLKGGDARERVSRQVSGTQANRAVSPGGGALPRRSRRSDGAAIWYAAICSRSDRVCSPALQTQSQLQTQSLPARPAARAPPPQPTASVRHTLRPAIAGSPGCHPAGPTCVGRPGVPDSRNKARAARTLNTRGISNQFHAAVTETAPVSCCQCVQEAPAVALCGSSASQSARPPAAQPSLRFSGSRVDAAEYVPGAHTHVH
jgi:hypothetical protein